MGPTGKPNWVLGRRKRRLLGIVAGLAVAATVIVALAVVPGGQPSSQRSAGEAHTTASSGDVRGLVTRHIRVTVSPSNIRAVVSKDSIPALDQPDLAPVAEIDFLKPQEPVVEIEVGGEARAYPLEIMTWHEIVNDVVGGTPVAVTFCPLCNTALAYVRPTVKGTATTFGTSGSLYHSNLVMYDRATDSLWPQALGQAVAGSLKGALLKRVPARIVAWADFEASFPDGRVLTRATGFDRPYANNPYPGYDNVNNPPFLFEGPTDGRLEAVDRVLGVSAGRSYVAFPYAALAARARNGVAAINTHVAGRSALVVWKRGAASALDAPTIATSKRVGAAAAFRPLVKGRPLRFASVRGRLVDERTHSAWNIFGRAISGRFKGTQLRSANATDSFWFDWAAFHPDTKVWRG